MYCPPQSPSCTSRLGAGFVPLYGRYFKLLCDCCFYWPNVLSAQGYLANPDLRSRAWQITHDYSYPLNWVNPANCCQNGQRFPGLA